MGKGTDLTLVDVGDAIFRVMQRYFFRDGTDPGVDMIINSSSLQESFFLRLPNVSTLLLKTFHHKNFMDLGVFRIEVYKTRPGDLRGNRVAFTEIPRGNDTINEIRLFIEGVLSQSEL